MTMRVTEWVEVVPARKKGSLVDGTWDVQKNLRVRVWTRSIALSKRRKHT